MSNCCMLKMTNRKGTFESHEPIRVPPTPEMQAIPPKYNDAVLIEYGSPYTADWRLMKVGAH